MKPTAVRLSLLAEHAAQVDEIESVRETLADHFQLTPCDATHDFALVRTAERWELRNAIDNSRVYADFVDGAVGHRRQFGGGRGQAIARACGLKGGKTPKILDVTAGLGRDAFVLASLGCTVQMVERSPLVALLLSDGLRRARENADTAPIVARMPLIQGDACKSLVEIQHASGAEVIYLDPMFPLRKKSASVKKEMKSFHQIVGEDPDSKALLHLARSSAAKRVTVKRPAKAGPLAGNSPDAQIVGKSTRFDLYFNP